MAKPKKSSKKKPSSISFEAGNKKITISGSDVIVVKGTKKDVEQARALALCLLRASDYAEMEVLRREEMCTTQFGSVQTLLHGLADRGYDVRIKIPSKREMKKRQAAVAEAMQEAAARQRKRAS